MPTECRYDLNFLFSGGCVSGSGSLLWISIKCLLCSFQRAQVHIRTLVRFLSPVLPSCPWRLLWSPRWPQPLILPHHSSAFWVFYPCFHSNFQWYISLKKKKCTQRLVGGPVVKNPPCNAGDLGLTLGWGNHDSTCLRATEPVPPTVICVPQLRADAANMGLPRWHQW